MTILTRNVTGADLLSIRKTVSDERPISEESLLERYFPGDSSDPKTADQRKPIVDAIEFLVETGQITKTTDGYELTASAADFQDARLGLLYGIRTATGDNTAYNDVIEYLAQKPDILFDREGKLLDGMNDRNPGANWNDTKLRYWERVMDEIGITKSINGSETTTLFGPNRELALQILARVTKGKMTALESALVEVDEQLLPVLTDSMGVASYFERTLLSLNQQGDIQLSTVSDIGQSVKIGDTKYSAIEVMTNE